jgi:hypothetical protein
MCILHFFYFASLPHKTKDDNVCGVGSTKNEKEKQGEKGQVVNRKE